MILCSSYELLLAPTSTKRARYHINEPVFCLCIHQQHIMSRKGKVALGSFGRSFVVAALISYM